ncbi:hypothetical protein ACMV8I_08775 [Ewingella sp. S1.OA.A_B6]
MDLLELSELFDSASLTLHHQLEITVRDYAKEVEKEAKEEIGHYQSAVTNDSTDLPVEEAQTYAIKNGLWVMIGISDQCRSKWRI